MCRVVTQKRKGNCVPSFSHFLAAAHNFPTPSKPCPTYLVSAKYLSRARPTVMKMEAKRETPWFYGKPKFRVLKIFDIGMFLLLACAK